MTEPIRVLYADGSSQDRQNIRQLLERQPNGFVLAEAGSPAELDHRLAEGEFDLVLVDLNFPELTAAQLLDRVRSRKEKLPVVLITGAGPAEKVVQALRGGVDGCVLKKTEELANLPAYLRSVASQTAEEGESALREAGLRHALHQRNMKLEGMEKELESFCYSVSHDLRAPLRAIEGFAGILAEDYGAKLDADGRHYLEVIIQSSAKMNQLIEDLLTFSRLMQAELQEQSIDMNGLAASVLEELQSEHPERKLDLRIEPLPPAYGDPDMCRKVWFQLLCNAFKFTRNQPCARIEISASPGEGSNSYHVHDNGVGFDMKYSHRLFGLFQKLHRIEDFEGSGVGLAMAQRVVHRHGGRIWAESKINEGATFSFALPSGKR